MKKIYVAGAYSDDEVLSILRNIGRGEAYAANLFLRGFAPFAPWFDKSFVILCWTKEFTVEQFYQYSLEWLKVSDAVFVVPNFDGMKRWQDSRGTLKEIEVARENDIPVFYDINELENHFNKEDQSS